MLMDAIIVISGPTGSGKTSVAVELAKLLNGEIISADSRQVYKHLDVGTNKEGVLDAASGLRYAAGIPQHLTDIIEPSASFSAGEFARRAMESIDRIRSAKKIPIVAGGTGLYIKALIDGLAEMPANDEAVRSELRALLKERGTGHLYDLLKKVDPESAEKNKDNPQRLIRAIEVFRITGVPISELQKRTKPSKENFAQFGLLWPREELYRRINARSREMIKNGMAEEAEKVLRMGYSRDCPGLQGLGYRSAVEYLEKSISRNEFEDKLSQDNRNYAKRQLTWFKKDSRLQWLEADPGRFAPDLVAKRISDMVE